MYRHKKGKYFQYICAELKKNEETTMRVKNAAAAAPTIFNLFFLSRCCSCCCCSCCCCRPTFADITHTHHWPWRLSCWGFLWSPLPLPLSLPSLQQLLLPQILSTVHSATPSTRPAAHSMEAISAPMYPDPVHPGHCWLVCLHALSHLGISLAFCSFFERLFVRRPWRPMVAVVVRAGAVPIYIFIYFIFHSRTHAIKLVKNALPPLSRGKNEQEVNNVQAARMCTEYAFGVCVCVCVCVWNCDGVRNGGTGQTDGRPLRCILLGASMHPYRRGDSIFCSIWGVVGFIRFLCVQRGAEILRCTGTFDNNTNVNDNNNNSNRTNQSNNNK